jgi:CRP-like cAMP-binding protein
MYAIHAFCGTTDVFHLVAWPSASAQQLIPQARSFFLQVCLLGGGAIIGDMSVRESGGGPPRRSATVVALTELVTYKVPLKEFKRCMPADVLEVS